MTASAESCDIKITSSSEPDLSEVPLFTETSGIEITSWSELDLSELSEGGLLVDLLLFFLLILFFFDFNDFFAADTSKPGGKNVSSG